MKLNFEARDYISILSIAIGMIGIGWGSHYGKTSIAIGEASIAYAVKSTANLQNEHKAIIKLIQENRTASLNEHKAIIKLVQENREISQYEHAALKESLNEIH